MTVAAVVNVPLLFTPKEAKAIDRSSPDYDMDRKTQTMTVAVPDSEQWAEPFGGWKMTAEDMAETFADDLELNQDCGD